MCQMEKNKAAWREFGGIYYVTLKKVLRYKEIVEKKMNEVSN